MNKRVSNKKHFDGIDPQKSLMKSLESIKSLLKQGDSKISEARENLARADILSSDTIESRLNDQSANIPLSNDISSNSIPKPKFKESPIDLELNDKVKDSDMFEEIILDVLPENTIFSQNSKTTSTKNKDTQKDKTQSINEKTNLSEFYDHDLIVPMLEEVVMPEDDPASALFHMDSSVEIKLDSKLNSAIIELDDIPELTNLENNIELISEDQIQNSISKSEISSNADILSFELTPNTKKNSANKSKTKLESSNTIPLIDDSLADKKVDKESVANNDHVVIKETTVNKLEADMHLNTKDSHSTEVLRDTDLSTAIETATLADDVLANITNSNIRDISEPASEEIIFQDSQEIDFANIDGLDKLNFNVKKMDALQKRVEKKVHNRLIQLIVQLDDEIKTILSEEIRNTIIDEGNNQNTE